MTHNSSPYSRAATNLIEQGYSAIPVLPGSKRPGQFSYGEWYGETQWQRFCDRLPTEYEVPIWSKWPDAGVCIALDHTVKCIDIDTDDGEIVAAVLAVLPDSPVKKRGRKGFSAFYRGSADIMPRAFSILVDGKEERIVDLLAYGKQTLLPPTIHATTGRPYEWITPDTLEYTSVDQLPELPDDIADRLAETLEPFGYHPAPVQSPLNYDVESGDSIWRDINNLALANLDAWVPDLRLPLTKRLNDGRYRAVAEWRGVENPNLSFASQGITDWGNQEKFTPISLVMRCMLVEPPTALDWLKERLNYQEPDLGVKINVASIIAKAEARRGVVVMEELPAVAVAPPPPEPVFTMPPGLVGDIAAWLTTTARNPSPILNLGAALAFVGALAGRRYAGPTNLRTNVYIVGLADSGFGKEHPRAATKTLANKAGVLAKFFGGEAIASSSALRNRVKANPTLVYMIDEFGGFLRKITNPRAGNHEKEIGDDLLKFTGSAGSIFMGADYAANLAEPIHNPNVCIYGTSTPETFWKALGSGSIADGFLPRFIVLDAGPERPEPRDPSMSADTPPRSLIEKIQGFVTYRSTSQGNLNAMTADGKTACVAIPITWRGDAKRIYDRFVDEMFQAMDKADTSLQPIYARVAENAMRLAGIVAAGACPENPGIDDAIMQWATDVAYTSANMLMSQAEERVADNEKQAEYKRVRAIVAKAKGRGVTRNDVARVLKGVMDRRRMTDIIEQLVEAGEVFEAAVVAGNGRVTNRLFSSEFLPKNGGGTEEERGGVSSAIAA